MANTEEEGTATGVAAGEETAPGQVAPTDQPEKAVNPEGMPEEQATTAEVLAAFGAQLEEIEGMLAAELLDNLTGQKHLLSEQAAKLRVLYETANQSGVDANLLASINDCISSINVINTSAANAQTFAASNESLTKLETLGKQIETPEEKKLSGSVEDMELQMTAIKAEGELRKNSSAILAEALGAINTIKGIYARTAELEKRKKEVVGFRDSFTAVEKGLIAGVELANTVEETNARVDANTSTIHELRSAIFQLVLSAVDIFTAGKAATERDMAGIKQDLNADSKVIKATLATLLEGIRTGDWDKLKSSLTTLGVFTNDRYAVKVRGAVAAYEAAQESNAGEALVSLRSMRDGVQLGQALGAAHTVIEELKAALTASKLETNRMFARAMAAEARVAKLAPEAATAAPVPAHLEIVPIGTGVPGVHPVPPHDESRGSEMGNPDSWVENDEVAGDADAEPGAAAAGEAEPPAVEEAPPAPPVAEVLEEVE